MEIGISFRSLFGQSRKPDFASVPAAGLSPDEVMSIAKKGSKAVDRCDGETEATRVGRPYLEEIANKSGDVLTRSVAQAAMKPKQIEAAYATTKVALHTMRSALVGPFSPVMARVAMEAMKETAGYVQPVDVAKPFLEAISTQNEQAATIAKAAFNVDKYHPEATKGAYRAAVTTIANEVQGSVDAVLGKTGLAAMDDLTNFEQPALAGQAYLKALAQQTENPVAAQLASVALNVKISGRCLDSFGAYHTTLKRVSEGVQGPVVPVMSQVALTAMHDTNGYVERVNEGYVFLQGIEAQKEDPAAAAEAHTTLQTTGDLGVRLSAYEATLKKLAG